MATGRPISSAYSQVFSVLTSTPATALTHRSRESATRRPALVSEKKMP